jgi:hypothetical protein
MEMLGIFVFGLENGRRSILLRVFVVDAGELCKETELVR